MKLGLIGVGAWGKNYISTIDRLPNVSISAVCRKSIEIPIGIPSDCAFFSDWEAMLDTVHHTGICDGLIVATPPDSHIPIAIRAKSLGIPIMIEKPLAMTAQGVKELIDANGSSLILVNHIHLFAHAFETLLENIKSPVIAIQSAKWGPGPHRNYSSLHDYGSHVIAMAIQIMGGLPDSVKAVCNATKSGFMFDVTLRWGDVVAVLRVGNGGESKRHRFQVFCEGSPDNITLEYDDFHTNKLRINNTPIHIDPEPSLDSVINSFIRSIRGVPDRRCGLELSYDVARVLDMCVTSIVSS